MALDVSSVLIAIFVMSKGYCTVLDINLVELQKKGFQRHRVPPQVRKSVEKVILFISSAFQSLSHSEFTPSYEFVGMGSISCIEYGLNSTGHRA